MSVPRAKRGQPLLVLGLVLAGWVSLRAMLWETPGLSTPRPGAVLVAGPPTVRGAARRAERLPQPVFAAMSPTLRSPSSRSPSRSAATKPPQALAPLPVRLVAGQHLLFIAAFADVPLPDGLARSMLSALPPAFPPPDTVSSEDPARRWSADAWLLLRPGGKAADLGAATTSTYGASQAGAVVRYRLAPGSGRRPAVYLRGSAALNGSRQREAALGLSARPLAGVPVIAAVEARVTDDRFSSRVRPVATAITKLAPLRLPRGIRGEAYVQAGYVGGKAATGFVDGLARVDGLVAASGGAQLRAGAGVWGGAQKDAARLDLGPTVALGVPLTATTTARASFDWRFRVAGKATPASGPALTLSAGF